MVESISTREGGVMMRSSGPSMSAGDHAPIRTSQHPTTSGQLASGVVATGRIGTTTGSRGPQPRATAAINDIPHKLYAALLVLGAT